MKRRTRWIIGAAAAGVLASGAVGGVAVASGGGDTDTPITGAALAKAEAAALAETGGGKVTDTEVGDEESYYEVEVTLPDGSQVDVQLDESFTVVGSTADEEESGESGDGENG